MTRFCVRPALGFIAIVVVSSVSVPSRADEAQSFIIAPRDGYGISECLEKTEDCGRVVADAWCESHGLSKALSYGHVDDVTSAIPRIEKSGQTANDPPSVNGRTTAAALSGSTEKIEPGSYVINCQQ